VRAAVRRGPRLACAAAVAVALLALPQAAAAHAVLEDSSPRRGSPLERPPERVVLRFNEPVEVAFGSVRVYDAAGERIERGSATHPGGRSDEVAVGLRTGLGDGTYTVTYRVISADSHPVAGGFVFTVGEGGAAPQLGVDELIDAGSAGPVTEVAFGVVRAAGYLAIALGAGGLVFALAAWRPSLRHLAEATPAWRSASEAFATRTRRLLLAAAVTGVASSALGIALQGATAAATSFWAALEPAVVHDVLGTRFGTVWSLRLACWLLFGVLVALPAARAAPLLRPASLGATGLAIDDGGRRAALGAVVALAAFICLTPALAGHAATVEPTALLVPANALHVTAMAIWVGGIAMLLLALPAATQRLEAIARTPLLAEVVAHFSAIATFAVAALVASGALQAIVELHALSDLWESAFGRAILAKATLVLGLLAIGAWNRHRARPFLAQLAGRGQTPGRTGLLLRRALVGEAALMAAVLAVTAALASYAPPTSATGPFAGSEPIGPAHAELTVDPARPGANEAHVYLFDRRDGRPFDRSRELALEARLPERDIGPIDLPVDKGGPGHYVVHGADLAPAGTWRLDLTIRVSAFDAHTARFEVPVN
jgi:copper transport protein